MNITISTDILSDKESSFLKSSFDDGTEIRIFANSGHRQLSEEFANAVPILISLTVSAAMSGITWDALKASLINLFHNRSKKLSKELTVRISTKNTVITITNGKKVIDSSSEHIVVEGATEELIKEIVFNKNQLQEKKLKRNIRRQGVFISYSHVDRKWLDKLDVHLKPHMHGEKFYAWDDREITPGSKWAEEIDSALNSARVAVLLVSPDFLASDFIMSVELPRIIHRVENDNLTILWVPIRDSSYEITALAQYQAAFSPRQPLASLSNSELDSAFNEVAESIARALDMNSVGNSLQIIDAFAAEAEAYTTGTPEPFEHSYEIATRQVQATVSLSQDGQDLTTITGEDLGKLPTEQRQLIRSHERVMQELFERWTEIKPKRVARDHEIKERACKESDLILTDLCSELTELLDFIEFMGMRLYDHYMHVRFICKNHSRKS